MACLYIMMKCEGFSGSPGLTVHNHEQDEPNTIVREQINPCIIPSRYYVYGK